MAALGSPSLIVHGGYGLCGRKATFEEMETPGHSYLLSGRKLSSGLTGPDQLESTRSYRRQNNRHVDCGPLNERLKKRREVELDPQVSPEEIMSREVRGACWAAKVGLLSFASGHTFLSRQCNGHTLRARPLSGTFLEGRM